MGLAPGNKGRDCEGGAWSRGSGRGIVRPKTHLYFLAFSITLSHLPHARAPASLQDVVPRLSPWAMSQMVLRMIQVAARTRQNKFTTFLRYMFRDSTVGDPQRVFSTLKESPKEARKYYNDFRRT